MATMSTCVKWARIQGDKLTINANLLVPGKYKVYAEDLAKLRYRFTKDNAIRYGDKLDSTKLDNTIEIVDFWPQIDRDNRVKIMSRVVIRDAAGNSEVCQVDQSYLIFNLVSLTTQALPFYDMAFDARKCR